MWQLWSRSPDGVWTLLNEYTFEQEVMLNQDLIWIHNRDRINKIPRSLHAIQVGAPNGLDGHDQHTSVY